jgi:hypothetical protein
LGEISGEAFLSGKGSSTRCSVKPWKQPAVDTEQFSGEFAMKTGTTGGLAF